MCEARVGLVSCGGGRSHLGFACAAGLMLWPPARACVRARAPRRGSLFKARLAPVRARRREQRRGAGRGRARKGAQRAQVLKALGGGAGGGEGYVSGLD